MKSVLKVLMLAAVTQFTVQACAKSVVTEPVVDKKEVQEEVVQTPSVVIDTLDIKCDPLWGTDSVLAKTNYVKYRDYFSRQEYANALPLWRYVFINAPCAREQTLADGHYMLDYLAAVEEDADRTQELVDTMIMVYDYRLQLYPEKRGSTLEKKAYSVARLTWQKDLSDSMEVLNMFEESYKLQGNNISYYTISYYFQYYKHALQGGERNLDDFINLFFELSEYCDAKMAGAKNETVKGYWLAAKEYMASLADEELTCEKLEPYYRPKFEANPQDLELIKEAMDLLKRKGCKKGKLYNEMLNKRAEIEPGFDIFVIIAEGHIDNKDYNSALKFYQKALDVAPADSMKVDVLYNMALIALDKQNNCTGARNYANQILAINPSYGKAYMVIGRAYATCRTGADEQLENRSAYWAAADKMERAKAVDPSLTSLANSYIADYKSKFPDKNLIFFVPEINEGDSFKVGGWINETTIVRARPE